MVGTRKGREYKIFQTTTITKTNNNRNDNKNNQPNLTIAGAP